MIEFATTHYEFFVLAHAIATALGLGAATVTDFLFFKFLKDYKVSKQEALTLSNMSQIIWMLVVVIVITGLALYLPQSERLNESPKFLVKMIGLAVIIVNGAWLNLLISPRMEQIFSGQSRFLIPRYWRRLAFMGGAISMASWYSVFIFGAFKSWPQDFQLILTGYLSFVAFAIVLGQISEALFNRRSKQ
jgi:hypothetical protein